MNEPYTPGAVRWLERAEVRAAGRGGAVVTPDDLLEALPDEPESQAWSLLLRHGLDPAQLGLPPPPPAPTPPTRPPPHSPELRVLLAEAALHARRLGREAVVGTEQLLLSLLEAGGAAVARYTAAGLDVAALLAEATELEQDSAGPITIEEGHPALDLSGPTETVDLLRILDAAANRAGEGLRVVEDYVRFVLDEPGLTRRLKDARHRLGQAVRGLGLDERALARDTRGDVGTHIALPTERVRENPRAVLTANFKRAAEALRSLEEYAKLSDVWLAGRFEVLRYDVYTLEKLTLTAVRSFDQLGDVRLYVLVGGLPTLGDLRWVVEEALAGGAQAIQLREKGLPDRELLRRAREVRLATIQAGARFVLNDRPDLARLAAADGVHLGQDDLTLRDARRIVGPRALIGISTHDRAQLDQAVLDGANYLGVGPVFPSATKDFADLAGLAFVRQAAESVRMPWFAIGGIDNSNIEAVLEAGAERVAVSSAVVRAPSPRAAAAALRARLDAAE